MSNLIVSDMPIGTKQPVNLKEVITFEKYEHQSVAEERGRYQIMFLRNENSVGPKEIFWKYKSLADRDADYDKLIELHTSKL